MKGSIIVDIRNMPEVIYELRKKLAEFIREEAKDEDPRMAAKLNRIADQFEAGQEETGG